MALTPIKASSILLITALALIAGAGVSCSKKASTLSELQVGVVQGPPETVTVEIHGYCPTALGRGYKDLFVSNFSTRVYKGKLALDSDKDGVPDEVEDEYQSSLNVSAGSSDTNSDGFSDFLIYLSGIAPSQQSRLTCNSIIDTDGDGIYYQDKSGNMQFVGLNDCEESRLTQTDPNNFDSDGDGIPDYIELRCGLNPKDGKDALLDPDGDGVLNIVECKANTPPDESNNPQAIKQLAYKYTAELDTRLGSGCMKFTVSNIPILQGGDDNLIALYLTESDAQQKSYLFTSFILLTPGSGGKSIIVDFGPDPKGSPVKQGRFVTK